MRSKVTIQEIADHIGLSKYAVSRALSGKPGVSAQTRELIINTAGKLGYFKDSQNPAAASSGHGLVDLDTRTWSGTILVLFPNVRYQNTDSLYWGPVFNGISSRLNQKKINIMTLTEPADDSMFSLLKPEAIMGIITIGSISTPILFDFKRLGLPVVMVDHLDYSFKSDSIFADNLAGMKEIMSALIRKGYKKYQFIGKIADAQSYYERWLGFSAALQEHKIAQEQIPELLDHDHDAFYEMIERVFKTNELPEVFVCANDFYVSYTIETFERLGVNITDKCIFTGFDNMDPSLPSKATVNVDKELLGRRAVDQMLWRILNPNSSYEKKLISGDVIFKD